MTNPGTLLYYLQKSTTFLEKKGISSPRLDAEVLLAAVLSLRRIDLYSKFDMPLSLAEEKQYRDWVMERGKFKPIAYILGKKGFYNSEFLVDSHVLIPRPETEELVEFVSKHFLVGQEGLRILDLGTGSGCIGLSLALEHPQNEYILCDISELALSIAKQNAERLKVQNVKFVQSDLFHSLTGKFDIIVSNPPYIPSDEFEMLMPDVKNYEPIQSLLVTDFDGFHRQIFASAYQSLQTEGKILLETNPGFADRLDAIAREEGFARLQFLKDLSGKNRFLLGSK